jgi:hypothetical protein
MEKQLT